MSSFCGPIKPAGQLRCALLPHGLFELTDVSYVLDLFVEDKLLVIAAVNMENSIARIQVLKNTDGLLQGMRVQAMNDKLSMAQRER